MELRLRTVLYLVKMYRQLYGLDPFFQRRLAAMLKVFSQQLTSIESSLSEEERGEHVKKFMEFKSLMKDIKREGDI